MQKKTTTCRTTLKIANAEAGQHKVTDEAMSTRAAEESEPPGACNAPLRTPTNLNDETLSARQPKESGYAPDHPNLNRSDQPSEPTPRKQHSGLRRHKLIVASCVAFSLSMLGLSTLDLSSLTETDGIVDSNLHVIKNTPPTLPENLHYCNYQFDSLDTDSNSGLLPIVEGTWQGERYGFADMKGKVVIAPKFAEVKDFHEGRASVALPTGSDSEFEFRHALQPSYRMEKPLTWGYIDTKGNMVIAPKFSKTYYWGDRHGGEFSHGIASVSLKGKWGLIDRDGQFVYPANLRSCRVVGDVAIAEAKSSRVGLLNSQGQWILPPDYNQIRAAQETGTIYPSESWFQGILRDPGTPTSDVFKICKDGQWGLADRSGKVLIAPQFDDIGEFHSGALVIKAGDKYGFVDRQGKIIIPAKFDAVTAFDKLIAVRYHGHWHFMTMDGTILPTPSVDAVITDRLTGQWLKDGFGLVFTKGRYRFVNVRGEFAFNASFDAAEYFREGHAPVYVDGYWHYLDTTGRISSAKFGALSQFYKGQAIVTVPGPLYGFVHAADFDEFKAKRKQFLDDFSNQISDYGND